eukprot:g13084.t1
MVATVGLTFTEAVTQLGAVRVSARLRRLDHVDRAICEYETRGFIKMVVSSSGLLLGATVVAPNAGEIASELGLAVAQKLKLQDVCSGDEKNAEDASQQEACSGDEKSAEDASQQEAC